MTKKLTWNSAYQSLINALQITETNYPKQGVPELIRDGMIYLEQLRKCKKCGQVDEGQTGEYSCSECGLPLVWDE